MPAGHDRVIVLDRDGTLVIDREYLRDPAGLEFMPGAAEGLRRLHAMGYRLIVATNQSGIGRGLYSVERLHEIHHRLTEMVHAAGAHLSGIYYCPHTPQAGCACRKPAPGLLLQAAAELGFEPASAIVIGDKSTDIEFGRRVGATTILLAPHGQAGASSVPESTKGDHIRPDHTAGDFLEAVQTIRTL
ncbi:MAG TPA: HAD family hydrolase [Steroidobacteraceae bacterium]